MGRHVRSGISTLLANSCCSCTEAMHVSCVWKCSICSNYGHIETLPYGTNSNGYGNVTEMSAIWLSVNTPGRGCSLPFIPRTVITWAYSSRKLKNKALTTDYIDVNFLLHFSVRCAAVIPVEEAAFRLGKKPFRAPSKPSYAADERKTLHDGRFVPSLCSSTPM